MLPEFEPYITGDVRRSWEKCLIEWRKRGRVSDRPKGVKTPRYAPDLGRRLGWEFAEAFPKDREFLVSRLTSGDPVESLCAFEVLESMFEFFESRKASFGEPMPEDLLDVKADLPSRVVAEIRSEYSSRTFKGRSVGEFFRFLSVDHDP